MAKIDITVIQEQIWEVLREHLQGMKENLKDHWEDELKVIAAESARYVSEVLRGSPEAEQNMRHLKAQVMLVGAIIAIDERDRVVDTVEKVAVVAAEILSRVLLGL